MGARAGLRSLGRLLRESSFCVCAEGWEEDGRGLGFGPGPSPSGAALARAGLPAVAAPIPLRRAIFMAIPYGRKRPMAQKPPENLEKACGLSRSNPRRTGC